MQPHFYSFYKVLVLVLQCSSFRVGRRRSADDSEGSLRPAACWYHLTSFNLSAQTSVCGGVQVLHICFAPEQIKTVKQIWCDISGRARSSKQRSGATSFSKQRRWLEAFRVSVTSLPPPFPVNLVLPSHSKPITTSMSHSAAFLLKPKLICEGNRARSLRGSIHSAPQPSDPTVPVGMMGALGQWPAIS